MVRQIYIVHIAAEIWKRARIETIFGGSQTSNHGRGFGVLWVHVGILVLLSSNGPLYSVYAVLGLVPDDKKGEETRLKREKQKWNFLKIDKICTYKYRIDLKYTTDINAHILLTNLRKL